MIIPPGGLTVGVDARNHDAVVKWSKLHINPPKYLLLFSFRTKSEGSIYKSEDPTILSTYISGLLLALYKRDCQIQDQGSKLCQWPV